MLFSSWLRNWRRSAHAARRGAQTSLRQRLSYRPRLEALEERRTPSTAVVQTNLVAYTPGLAPQTDPNLNGWGMTGMPNGSFVVANAFTTGLATFYSASGHVLPQTITVPVEAAESEFLKDNVNPNISTTYGHPTGVVYNPTSQFVISENGKSAPATLIFDTLDGTLDGWNPAVDPTKAIPIPGWDTWAAGHPAVFTGLEIGQDSQGNPVLYAADFLNNQLEVINGSFTTIKTVSCAGLGVSSDPNSSIWSVQAVGANLYVTFADLFGPTSGGGAVDVFNGDGSFQYQLDANDPGTGGRLQNPWGITQAPANFGTYSNDLLVGNVAGAGHINVYDPNTHQYLGQLDQPDGSPIAIKGLWDLEFGDGTPQGGQTNQLFFDAGPNRPGDATGGLFGSLQVLTPGSVIPSGSTLYIAGGQASNDQVQISPAGASNTGSTGVQLHGTLNGAPMSAIFSQAFTSIHVLGGGGNENIQFARSLTIDANISAGNGNDNIQAGNGDYTISLGNGNDNIQLGDGNNNLTLGGGNDNVQAGNGNNTIAAGDGNDNVQVGNGNNTITLGNGNDNVQAGDGADVIQTGDGHDHIQVGHR